MKNYFSKLNLPTPISQLPTSSQGFTIIETLVALTIFTTSILAIIVMTPGSVSAINLTKNKLTASYLAQEGIDLVRAYRDNGNLVGQDVLTDVLSHENVCGDTSGQGCVVDIDPASGSIVALQCQPGGCDALGINPDGGFWHQQSQTPSIFTRKITVIANTPPDFVVTSLVTWSQGGQPHTVQYQTNLTNWNFVSP